MADEDNAITEDAPATEELLLASEDAGTEDDDATALLETGDRLVELTVTGPDVDEPTLPPMVDVELELELELDSALEVAAETLLPDPADVLEPAAGWLVDVTGPPDEPPPAGRG